MQLSRLEIKGFKSFGERISIQFDEGITGIVGPNGCGKSNVVDAIRWVLGEQKSRMLRSEKMENIIFNGTKKRKPTQLAEVSLTFNNTKNLLPTEYTHVTITRRYYRSGESEYELNGVPCRLKDITDLFMDTGISSNSYAIIELKMVDDILNDKDNSRRGLFEEAAGISKFKIRKKETMRKLSDTDADLERVEDLLYEIEKNLKSLERQARQAEKYYKIKEDYKESSLKLAALNLADFRIKAESIRQQVSEQQDKKVALSSQISGLESSLEEKKAEILQKEKSLHLRQKALNEHVSRIRQYESDKKIKNERLRYLNDRCQKLESQITSDKQSIERTQFSIQGLERDRNEASEKLKSLQVKLNELQSDYEAQKALTQGMEEEVNEASLSLKSLQQSYFEINKSVELKEVQISSIEQELERSDKDASSQSENINAFSVKENELTRQIEDKEKELATKKSREDSLRNNIEKTEKTIQVIKDELNGINRKIDAQQHEYNLTKSLVENLEGFPEAIKFLKKKSNWGKEAPLLSDIITTDEKYRVAIENYLEPYMNYYVVDSRQQAMEAVNLLRDASKGKAQFFILEAFEKYRPVQDNIFGDATPATEIVEYDQKYGRMVAYLLDKVYLIHDISQAPDDPDAIFISTSGQVTQRRYSISGGSVGLFEGKRIGRAKNLEKLEKSIRQLKDKHDKVKKSLQEAENDLESLRDKLKEEEDPFLGFEISELKQELVSFRTKREEMAKQLDSAASRKQHLLEQLHILNEELEETSPRAEHVKGQVLVAEQTLNEKQNRLREHKELLSIKSSSFNEENIYFHRQENKVNSLEQEISFKQSTLEQNQERIATSQQELQSTVEEIKKLESTGNDEEKELIGLYEERDSLERAVQEAEKAYYAARGEVDEKEKGIREIQRSRETIDTLLMEYQQKENEIRIENRSVKERLSVEFDIEIDENNLPEVDEDRESLMKKVSGVRERLDKIGPINPMAMEAYEEIRERHEFITEQKKDLREAKESLISTIGEIDQVARETFIDAFDKIKANFMTVFRSLFTEEDDCDLILSDPENPLESKVEIIAKPKGKRPLTINQLSGGEKTLTATSLLFAIYLLKPAPFCIFDEVDAPLDDANIDKFNNIIRKFSKDSQFIIVTHNKRTMASTDIIYGVTMIEQGVSRVVPVDLRELAEN